MSISQTIEKIILPSEVYNNLVKVYENICEESDSVGRPIIISSCDKEDLEEITKRLGEKHRDIKITCKDEELSEEDRNSVYNSDTYTIDLKYFKDRTREYVIELKYFKDTRRERLGIVREFINSNKELDKKDLFLKAIKELRNKVVLTNLEEIIDTIMKEKL